MAPELQEGLVPGCYEGMACAVWLSFGMLLRACVLKDHMTIRTSGQWLFRQVLFFGPSLFSTHSYACHHRAFQVPKGLSNRSESDFLSSPGGLRTGVFPSFNVQPGACLGGDLGGCGEAFPGLPEAGTLGLGCRYLRIRTA